MGKFCLRFGLVLVTFWLRFGSDLGKFDPNPDETRGRSTISRDRDKSVGR